MMFTRSPPQLPAHLAKVAAAEQFEKRIPREPRVHLIWQAVHRLERQLCLQEPIQDVLCKHRLVLLPAGHPPTPRTRATCLEVGAAGAGELTAASGAANVGGSVPGVAGPTASSAATASPESFGDSTRA